VVPAGTVVGQLTGPYFRALWQQQKARVQQTMANETSAARLVQIEKKTLKDQISTQQTLVSAKQNLALAQAQRCIAQASLNALAQEAVLRAPTTGIVTHIEQGSGSFVQTGTAIAEITPTSQWLLQAQFFPTQSAPMALNQIKPGQQGWFLPLDSHHKIAVRVVSILPKDVRNGALPVILEPLAPLAVTDNWLIGQTGQVHLVGAQFSAVSVPTRALILDQGQWWVLVKTPAGWQRQKVRIGVSTGENTAIIAGLRAGTVVLVEQAYLEFHRDFATRYQQPD
jgi:multidrug efflux pump subunit AcrA (membrane-fusion protein)